MRAQGPGTVEFEVGGDYGIPVYASWALGRGCAMVGAGAGAGRVRQVQQVLGSALYRGCRIVAGCGRSRLWNESSPHPPRQRASPDPWSTV